MEKIGIMGGTFNPPHFGHFAIAQQAKQTLELDKVLFIPTGRIVYKRADMGASGWDRYNMLKSVIDKNKDFELSDMELVQDETTYTANTLKKLKDGVYKNSRIFFIVGADSLDYMEHWHNPKQIFDLCTVAVVGRMQIGEERLEKKIAELKGRFAAKIVKVDMPYMDVSSTILRDSLRRGGSIRYLTDDSIIEYIKSHRLYKN